MLKIQILGIGCKRSSALKDNVLEALKGQPLQEVMLEEITNIERIINYDIAGAPALIMNGQIVAEDTVLEVAAIRDLLDAYTVQPPIPFEIKRIVVPIDFSSVSVAAFTFAQALAKEQNAELKVVHVYHPEFDPANPYLSEPIGRFEKIKRNLLHDFVEAHQQSTSNGSTLTAVKIKEELLLGFPAEEIVRLSGNKDTDLLVMGTTGSTRFLERVFGSVSSHVAQKATCPVLFIPKDAVYRGFDHVLYASSAHLHEPQLLRRVAGVADRFQSELHFVHVKETTQVNGALAHSAGLDQMMQRFQVGNGYRMVNMEGKTIVNGLIRYARNNKIDLAIVSTQQRSFWEEIFHKSVTQRMLFATFLPLMVMHID